MRKRRASSSIDRRPEWKHAFRHLVFPDIVADTQDYFPILLKFHGGLDRDDPERDTFVITEDDYIDYVAQTALPHFIPDPVPKLLKDSHVLFLGHALRDWNLRVIFRQLWAERDDRFQWWAVQLRQNEPAQNEFDLKFWRSKHVDIVNCPLREYVTLLDDRLSELGLPGGTP
jgi:SIR2-like protein